MSKALSYVVVTPARNEQENIAHTIRSMAAQTIRPLRWVIVNDGSTDETARIIDEAAREHSWITAVHRKDRGFRKQGGGVIEAFYEGYALLDETNPLLLDRGEGLRVRSRTSADVADPNPLTPTLSPAPSVGEGEESNPLLLDRGEGLRVRSRTSADVADPNPLTPTLSPAPSVGEGEDPNPLLLERGEGSRSRTSADVPDPNPLTPTLSPALSVSEGEESNPLLLDRGEGSRSRTSADVPDPNPLTPTLSPAPSVSEGGESNPLLLDRGEGSRSRTSADVADLNPLTPTLSPAPSVSEGEESNPLLLDRGEGLRSRTSADVRSRSWDFVIKFDADLSFEPDYFERCLNKFAEDPKLGIGGGMISHEVNGKLVCESPGDPAFHVRGATKIYRRACWEAIHGLMPAPGWDTIDELKANMLGWTTVTFRDIPLRHHRFTGTADGTWKNYVKFGLSNYITGYHPLFMLVKCLKRCVQKPYLVGAVGLCWGFCRGYLKGEKQVADSELIRYVRRQQINKLLLKPSLW